MTLNQLRKKIDAVDRQIIRMLNQRAKISLGIGRIKSKAAIAVYSPDREKIILAAIRKLNKGPLGQSALEAIYREIMSGSRTLEKPLSIAYLGPPATFTHMAALKRFGSQANYLSANSIGDVFIDVQRKTADYGVVPIENSIEGAVTHTLDMLVDSDLKICSQILLDVTHNLLSKSGLTKIKKVYSNVQVFAQCRLWLQANLPSVELVEVSSTTKAAQICRKEKNSSCIASGLAAKVYGLNIVASDIEDSPHNITRFLVIANMDVAPTGHDKTSIIFSIKDRVGALHDMLMPFKKYKINLTKIESRPSKKKAWDYYFFVDLEGHYKDKKVKKALQDLEDKCTNLKILGSYPMAE